MQACKTLLVQRRQPENPLPFRLHSLLLLPQRKKSKKGSSMYIVAWLSQQWRGSCCSSPVSLSVQGCTGKLEERSAAALAELNSAAKAAATKVQYLEQVAADAARLACRYKTYQTAQALEEIRSAVSIAKEQEQGIRLHLERLQQQEQHKKHQVQEQEAKDWVARPELLDQAYSSAVAATYDLLKASIPPISASILNSTENTRRLNAIKDKTQRLCQDASAKLDPAEADILNIYRVAVQLDAEEVQDEVLMLHTARSRLEDRVWQQARLEAPPADLVQEALAVSRWATDGEIRVRELMQAASDWLEEGESAVVALCRSFATNLAVEVTDLRKQSELVRFMLQSVPIPESHEVQAQTYMVAGSTLDEVTPMIQQLHQELYAGTGSTHALGKLHLVRFLHKKASQEMRKASPIAVIPVEDDRQDKGETALALSFDGEIVREAVQQEADEEKRRQQTREMRSLLVASVTDALTKMSAEALSFDNETKRQLTEETGKRFAEGVLPSRRHFEEWQRATKIMEEAKTAAKLAAQLLAKEENRIVLQKTADEAMRQARVMATNANAATHHWLRCSAWLKVEKALTRALDSYDKASGALQQQHLLEHSQKQELQLSKHQEAARLQAEATSILQSGSIEAAARLASDIAELVRQANF
ncbi:hypothetical protein Emag_003973 [Eimeria magna]